MSSIRLIPERLAAPEFFRQGLRELGYIEGKNLIIEYRYADGRPGAVAGAGWELVRLKVDIIVTDTARSSALPGRQPRRYPL